MGPLHRSSRSVCAHLAEAWWRTGFSKPDVVQVAGYARSDVQTALAVVVFGDLFQAVTWILKPESVWGQ